MKKIIKISNKTIGEGEPVFIIAEAGVNHNGKLELALKLIEEAAKAGADAIKFQTFRAEQVVTSAGEMAEYQKRNLEITEKQTEMLRKLELPEKFYPQLIAKARELNIIFFSTPHGHISSVDLLEKFGVPIFKFGSGDLINIPLLEYAAGLGKPLIISTGMATMEEINDAIKTIRQTGNEQFVVLHCTTDYPCKPEEINLKAMVSIAQKFNCLTGYSDHTTDDETAIMAVALSACVLEKHFTLDRALPGPDQKASFEPKELANYIKKIRKASIILGSGIKNPVKSEEQYIPMARKSIVSAKAIKSGEQLTEKNLTVKRPGTGIPPKFWNEIIGKKATCDIPDDTLISREMFK